LEAGSLAFDAYQRIRIEERHRHRYEFNNTYLDSFASKGMIATGKNPDSGLVEIMEIPSHPWFVAAQFHPEYSSTVESPHPLFIGFLNASKATVDSTNTSSASQERQH
ncbi:MAG TPA: hypothetical protein DDZ19_06220, partial [Flavobacteriales bacterium]|nr:hypothetical protein [Flavobacteriales bacterium]